MASRKSKRMPPSRAVPCRVMSKSVDNEEHSYVPDKVPKFDGVSGCKITAKNKAMGDYRYMYPMLDSDGKTRLVTEHDFHHRMRHKYRALEGHSYVFPVLSLGIHEGKRSDLISVPECKETFVPEEVNRMIPQGVEFILTDYDDRTLLYIGSKRGDVYVADKRVIPYQPRDADLSEGEKPSVKTVGDVNKEGEPKPTEKQMRDIDRWKKKMEELNMLGNRLCGNRVVYFGGEVNREEWRDDDIMSWFDENYPEDTEESPEDKGELDDDGDDDEEEDEEEEEEREDKTTDTGRESRCAVKSSCGSSVDGDDSGYADRRKSSFVSSRMSCESFNSDDPRTEIEVDISGLNHNIELKEESRVVSASDNELSNALPISIGEEDVSDSDLGNASLANFITSEKVIAFSNRSMSQLSDDKSFHSEEPQIEKKTENPDLHDDVMLIKENNVVMNGDQDTVLSISNEDEVLNGFERNSDTGKLADPMADDGVIGFSENTMSRMSGESFDSDESCNEREAESGHPKNDIDVKDGDGIIGDDQDNELQISNESEVLNDFDQENISESSTSDGVSKFSESIQRSTVSKENINESPHCEQTFLKENDSVLETLRSGEIEPQNCSDLLTCHDLNTTNDSRNSDSMKVNSILEQYSDKDAEYLEENLLNNMLHDFNDDVFHDCCE